MIVSTALCFRSYLLLLPEAAEAVGEVVVQAFWQMKLIVVVPIARRAHSLGLCM